MKEYYNTYEVAEKFGINVKTVQRKIREILTLQPDTNLIRKIGYGWKIHQLAVPRFAPKKKVADYTALTIDTVGDYGAADLHAVMRFIVQNTDGAIDFHYSIETKTKNGKPHLHAYLPTAQCQKFMKALRKYVDFGYHTTPAYDLDGWQTYISKESPIITITKN